LYVELTASLPDATLPADIQLDVANELARSARNADAARAYGRFLERFRTHPAADDARLMLATIFMRRLGDRAAAAATLAGFGKRELDRDRAAMLAALRSECGGAPA
jgi:TolA-binding protein